MAIPIGADTPLKAWVRALEKTAPLSQQPGLSLPLLIGDLADRHEEAVALLSDDGNVSYRALANRMNQVARWAQAQSFAAGDVACLIMSNCPDYFVLWLGLTRIGVVVALVNPHLVGESLMHAVQTVAPRAVIVGTDLAAEFEKLVDRLGPGVRSWSHGENGSSSLPRLESALAAYDAAPVSTSECPPPKSADRALFIYTSGTTGLPKAANVSHRRLLEWTHWFAGMMNVGPNDRMYNCLPMYHSIGGVVAIGSVLIGGGSVVLRKRFSAGHFWEEVVAWDCTLFQYIGELCRFLVNSDPRPGERAHRLRLCCGNGLRPDVWVAFKERFRIPRILEYYAATEANFSLYNCEEKVGAIGRIPPFLAHRFPVALVQYDPVSGELVKDAEGFCVPSAIEQVGEAISQISAADTSAASAFEGYTDPKASAKKVLRDVFTEGDAWYRTGDLMRRDAKGFFYFVDRVGDTFRWKGENVSTTEIAELIAACPGVAEALVYGVAIPGNEGRAGMAALVVNEFFELAALREHLARCLPDYARPVFLRILCAIEKTATFKPKKQELSLEGYDHTRISDPLYWDDRQNGCYTPLSATLYERIQSGRVRL